jgi:hypothetical protein
MSSTPERLQRRIDGRRAWLGSGIGDARPWLVTLPSMCWDLLRGTVESWPGGQGDASDVRLDESQRTRGRQALAQVIGELDAGMGFVVLDRIPLEELSPDQAILAY